MYISKAFQLEQFVYHDLMFFFEQCISTLPVALQYNDVCKKHIKSGDQKLWTGPVFYTTWDISV